MTNMLNLWQAKLADYPHRDLYYRLCEELLCCMEREQLYLDAKLSLIKLSLQLGTNTSYLSGAVNRCLGENLHTLVNWYRVQYAKYLLSGEVNPCAICNLYTQCGFASKSAFYVSFARWEELSPLSYYTQNKNKQVREKGEEYKRMKRSSRTLKYPLNERDN